MRSFEIDIYFYTAGLQQLVRDMMGQGYRLRMICSKGNCHRKKRGSIEHGTLWNTYPGVRGRTGGDGSLGTSSKVM